MTYRCGYIGAACNLKTAKAFWCTMPPSLLSLIDEVIQ